MVFALNTLSCYENYSCQIILKLHHTREKVMGWTLTHFILETPKGVLAKSADPDQMPHNVASDLGLHYFASCSTIFQQKYLN